MPGIYKDRVTSLRLALRPSHIELAMAEGAPVDSFGIDMNEVVVDGAKVKNIVSDYIRRTCIHAPATSLIRDFNS